jgi:integrase/recombinase XerD
VSVGSLLIVFRHTAAVHLLQAGVEVNVIRGWLRHVSLGDYESVREITVRMKEAAMKLCEPRTVSHHSGEARWRDVAAWLTWLASL